MNDTQAVSARTPLIHIGMPKTATKTLQWRLFALHSEVYYLGRFDGGSFRAEHRQHRACRDAEVLEVMARIAYDNIFEPDMDACRNRMRDYLREHNPEAKLPVWSWESYCTDSYTMRAQRVKNLQQLFGEARILVTIRQPVKLLESAYLQQLKRDNIGARYRRGKSAFYCEIDDWVERDAHGDIDDHLDYARTIRCYTEAFGVDNVCVTTFEQLLEDPEAFWGEICQFMGVDTAQALELVAENEDNTRWSEIQLQRLQAIKRSPVKSLVYRFAQRSQRKQMLDLTRKGTPKTAAAKARPGISPRLQREICERTREGNLWLQETFGLDLENKGYMGT
ncbi:hypothetical protein E4634_10760 [Mangrovimicrobium sediminis]|uniref:Sulfotransferase domain-containing protein n=1 Tax=Mangrovimicrobium sediminis TaxID=2562682 RepID=A0A4Z0M1D4_9GAMM|nr:sulfotransferase [Haliea sp. SAOS-164]TGD73503.1 hypothetical protein E4634_10760 [Haliea sp. SAOS-164]